MRYRYLIYALIIGACGTALLLFDDIDIGLPMVNLILWPCVIVAGLVLSLRKPAPRSRASRSRNRRGTNEVRPPERPAIRQAARRLIDH